MALTERFRRLFDYQSRRDERRSALNQLADQVMPEFRKIVDFNARNHVGSSAKRLRQLLENHKSLVAVVERKGPEMLQLIWDKDWSGQEIHLTVAVNARKFLQSDFQQRNESFNSLLCEFSTLSKSRKPDQVFSKFDHPQHWSVPSEKASRQMGVNPDRAVMRIYG